MAIPKFEKRASAFFANVDATENNDDSYETTPNNWSFSSFILVHFGESNEI